MAPFRLPVHLYKLLFHVKNEITLICAKFSVNLTNIYKVTSCTTVVRCLALYDALTTTQATWRHWRHSSMTSFFIRVHYGHKMAYIVHICGGFGIIWLNKRGELSLGTQSVTSLHDSECYEPFCVTIHPRVTLVGESGKKLNLKNGVIFYLIAQTHPHNRLAQMLGACSSRGRNQLLRVLS